MKRKFISQPLNEAQTKYTVKLESEYCPAIGIDARKSQLQLLRDLIDNQGMLDCGPIGFQTFNMVHDGEKWVVTLEAIG
jgi:hypothetical protein